MANNVAGDPDVIFLPGLAASSLSYKGLQHLQVPRADGTTFAHKKEGAAFSCALLFIREKNILQKVPGDFPSISMVRIGSHALPLLWLQGWLGCKGLIPYASLLKSGLCQPRRE